MNQRNSNSISNAKTTQPNATHGLSFSGIVIDEARRIIPYNNQTTELVTCTVHDGYNRKFYIVDHALDR